MKKSKHGGKRKGAGRKPSDASLGASVAVRMPVGLLTRLGAVVPAKERSEFMRREIERGVAREEAGRVPEVAKD